jgi:hypothetical protein
LARQIFYKRQCLLFIVNFFNQHFLQAAAKRGFQLVNSRLRLLVTSRQSFFAFSWTKLDRRFLSTTSSKAVIVWTPAASLSFGVIFSLLFAGVFSIIQNYGNIKEAISDLEHRFLSTVAESTYPGRVKDSYVERSELEKLLTLEMAKTPNGKYCIVYGNKSVGKSSLFIKCATSENSNKKGYVRVVIGDPNVVKSLLEELHCEKMTSDIETEMRKVMTNMVSILFLYLKLRVVVLMKIRK